MDRNFLRHGSRSRSATSRFFAPLTPRQIVGSLLLGLTLVMSAGALIGGFSAGASALSVTDSADRLGESSGPSAQLSLGKAVILGAVEGLTEYLPVSSTGHLLVTERLLDIGTGDDKDATDSYTVIIQIGAILAVLGIYRKRLLSMAEGVVGRSAEGRQTAIAVLVAFVPFAIIGKTLGDVVKDNLLAPLPVAVTWIVGGAVILGFVKIQPQLTAQVESVSDLGFRHAAIIGCVQTLALIPGMSRSLITILAAMSIGVSMAAAVEFSFLLGFVTLSAATAYEILTNGPAMIDTFGIVSPLVGIAVAAGAAFVSVRFMIDWLNTRGLSIFGWYRLAIGIITIGLVVTDSIPS